MSRIDRDVWAIVGTTLVCAAVTVWVPVTAVRAVFAVPLCLVLPGYAVMNACFANRQFGSIQKLFLVPALSLATLAVGSVLLDVTPGGLRIGTWIILLFVVVAAGCVVTVVRRRPAPVRSPRPPAFRPRPTQILLLLFAVVAVGSSIAIARIPLGARNANGYTQLWMLSSGTTQAPAVRIGVRSDEHGLTTYRLVLRVGKHKSIVVKPSFTLQPGDLASAAVPLTGIVNRQTLVGALLYRTDSPRPYRKATAVVQSATP